MPEFVLIFRPARATSAADLPKRNATARDWVLALREANTLRAACPLEERGAVVTHESVRPCAVERAIASVLLIEAADLDAAVALAQGYPNLEFGSEIEVRPVRPTAPRPR
jgi:2-C-methyl-D-erythritol 4-phosphate cytidylyltransferase